MPDDPRQSTRSADPARTLQQAYQLHRQGNLAEAERLYALALKSNPNSFDALQLFGLLRLHQNRPSDALPLIDAALRQKPDSADALSLAAAIHHNMGRHGDALALFDRLIALRPADPDAHFNRGVILAALGRNDEAIASYNAALAARPDHSDARFNLGNALAATGRYVEALDCYDRLIAAAPNHLDALNNRGNALSQLGRYEEAIAAYGQALALRPGHPSALGNRGNALKKLGRHQEALDDYGHALALDPNDVGALYNRGNTLLDLWRPSAADRDFQRALAIQPDNPDVLISRGSALSYLRQPRQSIECYRRALALRPDDPVFHSDLIFALNFDPGETFASQQAERRRWYERHALPLAPSIRPHGNTRDPDRKLRIGYVSSHFRHQAATYVFGGVLAHHDRDAFEAVCYSDTRREDDLTDRLRGSVAKWHRTNGLSDDDLAELIRADGIDILVDLVGHMQGHRLPVFARKPAPLQVTAWGEPTGTGLRTMDYLFADPILVPAQHRPLLAEKVHDLPSTIALWSTDSPPPPAPLPALSRGHVTFGSFNRLVKVIDPVLRSWAAILRALPNARLVLKDRLLDDESQKTPILALLADEGIAAGRVTLLDQSDRAAHFAAFADIDIALDPFPHGGGMTTLDALWMGVPVVTWAGDTISSRLAASCLTAAGLADFVAPDPQAYIALAVAKARDLEALARLRAGLRDRVSATPVGDPVRYARAVEAAYRDIWRHWCESGV